MLNYALDGDKIGNAKQRCTNNQLAQHYQRLKAVQFLKAGEYFAKSPSYKLIYNY